jgi:SAM-dependent methyltransferase
VRSRSKDYGEDLAAIHEAGFGDVARGAAKSLVALLARRGTPRGLVVDLGCGPGILSAELARAGHDVLGIDVSPAMIARARRNAPRARFRVGSFRDSEIPSCAAVVAAGEIFSYVFDGAPDLERVFRRVHAALLPGGLFLFDVAAPGRVSKRGPLKLHREGDDWAILVTLETDARRRMLTRSMTSFRKVGRAYRRSSEVHRQRLFRAPEVERALRRAGFEARRLEGYAGRPFSPGQIGYLARKRAEART